MENKISIDYEAEYHRLKGIESENQKLKDAIVNMSIYMFQMGIDMTKTFEGIDKSLKKLAKSRR